MLADVAEPGCAEQSIGDRMEDDVRVAVAGKAARVRNRDAAEHDRTFAGEGVDIIAHAGSREKREARIASARSQSAGVVSFSSNGIAFDRRHLQPRVQA